MSSTIGNILKMTIFGESHSAAIGLTVDGLPAGIQINLEDIKNALALRKTSDDLSTSRQEVDEIEFLCGVFNNKTTGSPVTFIIRNKDTKSSDYVEGQIRPGHSDYTYFVKYDGNNDYRGGGFSSGRITAPIVALGAILKPLLTKRNITIGSHIKEIHGVFDDDFEITDLTKTLNSLNNSSFPVINNAKAEEMKTEIIKAKENKDSVGGILETVITGLPIGLGEPYFDSFESYVASLLFSIGGVKGVEFGDGFNFAKQYGSEVKDELVMENGKVNIISNHNGGLNGGLTNGNPVVIRTAIKPTSSIGQNQNAVNVKTNENINLSLEGRHDPCIVHRVRAVVNALLTFATVDLLMVNEGRHI